MHFLACRVSLVLSPLSLPSPLPPFVCVCVKMNVNMNRIISIQYCLDNSKILKWIKLKM